MFLYFFSEINNCKLPPWQPTQSCCTIQQNFHRFTYLNPRSLGFKTILLSLNRNMCTDFTIFVDQLRSIFSLAKMIHHWLGNFIIMDHILEFPSDGFSRILLRERGLFSLVIYTTSHEYLRRVLIHGSPVGTYLMMITWLGCPPSPQIKWRCWQPCHPWHFSLKSSFSRKSAETTNSTRLLQPHLTQPSKQQYPVPSSSSLSYKFFL